MKKLQKTLAHIFHPRRSNNHRPRILHPEAYVVLGVVMVMFVTILNSISLIPGNFSNVLGFASSITPSQVIEQTNRKRAEAGLEPITLNSRLTQAALSKGQDMMSDQYWAHVAPDGREPWAFIREAGYNYKVAGENLARDFGNTDQMMSAWMASPTHRANILNPKYTEIGIAVIDGELQGYETTLVVQMFGSPQAVVSQVGSGEFDLSQTLKVVEEPETQTTPQVLAGALVPVGELSMPPFFTPLQISKAFFLSLIMIIMSTLVYDAFISGSQKTVRIVGKNFAHILFFSVIAYLLIFFKGGLVG